MYLHLSLYRTLSTLSTSTHTHTHSQTHTHTHTHTQLGAGSGWISAKGFCGFLLWHTNTTLPDGTPYPYTARQAGQPDIVGEFVNAFGARGLGAGMYCA